ncbi:hypothetical protein [Mycolicibacterium fallax]|nr:hypothetical protein [Mycolicibacterium fallax]BBY97418.1 hypothetical protein MFAL_08850 [Mycolicibacterium fallax]HSA39727.1 hypothetical protein [Mycobacterium sp.]
MILATAVLAAGALSVAAPAAADPAAPPAPSETAAPKPGDGPKTSIEEDGTYAVGTDIVPGNYASEGPRDGSPCYWKRSGGENGTETLDNALTKKPAIVVIAPTDKSFRTTSCQTWRLTDQAPPPPRSPWEILGGIGQMAGRVGSAPPPAG